MTLGRKYLWGIVNGVFLAILYSLHRQGVLASAFENDIIYIIPTLCAAFAIGMVFSLRKGDTAYFVAESLLVLGFLGTLLGIWTAFSGVKAEHVGDVAAIGSVLAVLMEGLGAALWTTIVGAFLSLWLSTAKRTAGG